MLVPSCDVRDIITHTEGNSRSNKKIICCFSHEQELFLKSNFTREGDGKMPSNHMEVAAENRFKDEICAAPGKQSQNDSYSIRQKLDDKNRI